MRALVVVESMFGNTRAIAGAVAEGLSSGMEVEVVDAGDPAVDPATVDVLIVGGPTHAHGMSRGGTRNASARQATGRQPVTDRGLREFLSGLGEGRGRPAAAFDTRIDKPRWLVGSAARGAARCLTRAHFDLVDPPQSFMVHDVAGASAPG